VGSTSGRVLRICPSLINVGPSSSKTFRSLTSSGREKTCIPLMEEKPKTFFPMPILSRWRRSMMYPKPYLARMLTIWLRRWMLWMVCFVWLNMVRDFLGCFSFC